MGILILELGAKLEGFKERGGFGKFVARCPCHEGARLDSLSIRHTGDTTLMHCFVCEANGLNVVQALGLDIELLVSESKIKRGEAASYGHKVLTKDEKDFLYNRSAEEVLRGLAGDLLSIRVIAHEMGDRCKKKHKKEIHSLLLKLNNATSYIDFKDKNK